MACLMSNAAKQNIDILSINYIRDKIARNVYLNKGSRL